MKTTCGKMVGVAPLLTVLTLSWGCLSGGAAHGASKAKGPASDTESGYTDVYLYKQTKMIDKGETPYFILMPGYQMILEGPEGGEHITLSISILDETRKILVPDLGWVTTRIIEEKEWTDGIPKETSRTFFAIDAKTGNVYDFGDETDIYNDAGTEVESHEGGWLAGQPDDDGLAKAGIFMPGTFLLGAKYYQQLAEGNSMERAENWEMGLTIDSPAGTFEDCIRVRETNWSEPHGAETFKTHCPGIGLVGEDSLELVGFGYNIFDVDKGRMRPKHIVPISPIQAADAEPATQSMAMVRKISDAQAREIASRAVDGEVVDVAVERKMGAKRIVVEVIDNNGGENDVIIDMVTGEVLAVTQ